MIHTETTANGQRHTASASFLIGAPTKVVWQAIASPQGWNTWFTSGADFTCAVGERYTTADGDTGEFMSIGPERLIAFTWEHPKHPPGSVVTAILEQRNDSSTALHLTHGPFESPEIAHELEAAWTNILGVLKSRLEEPPVAKADSA